MISVSAGHSSQPDTAVQSARGVPLLHHAMGQDPIYPIFTQRDLPLPRHWHVPGTEVPSLAGFDHAMKTFMQADRRESAAIDRGDDRG
jgi:hypothetical protein